MTEDSIRVSPGRPLDARRSKAGLGVGLPLSLGVLVVLTLAILLAALIDDGFSAHRAWLYVTILGAAFLVGRGLENRV